MDEMKQTYTPAPWKVTDDGKNQTPTIKASYQFICKIKDTLGAGTTNANARLIAAAPELLEALLKCEDVIGMARLQGKLSDNALSPVNDALITARAAIAKATK
jgi:hypothetical protein